MNPEKTESIISEGENGKGNDLIPIFAILGIIAFVFFLLLGGSILFYKVSGLESISPDKKTEESLEVKNDKNSKEEEAIESLLNDFLDEFKAEVSEEISQEEDSSNSQNIIYKPQNSAENATTEQSNNVYDYAPPENYNYEPEPYCYTYDHPLVPDNHCFDWDDYFEATKVGSNYNTASFRKESAQSTIDFTCDSDSEIFQKSCDDAKERKREAEADMEFYASQLNSLIN